MTAWTTIILASIGVLALKVLGYLVPPTLIEKPTPSRITSLLTVALLSALIVVQIFGGGRQLVVDARVPALLVAAGLFALRVPFILVVISAALTAALIRLWI